MADRSRYREADLSDDWRQEVSSFQKSFEEVEEALEDDDFSAFLAASDFSDKRQKVLLLIDIAKRYLHPIEAEVMFLFLKNRRNKDISLILNIQEPEVSRYKKLIIKKSMIFYLFCYVIDITQYHGYVVELLQLNEKQAEIFKLFLQFRSLSYISEQIQSKSSNMHRSLNSIKEKLIEICPKHPEIEPVVKFYELSRYINNANPESSLEEDLI